MNIFNIFLIFSRVLEENPGNLEMDVIIDAVVSYNKRYQKERLIFNFKNACKKKGLSFNIRTDIVHL